MIKFFRQIRQQLLMENKTSKYFKYAIGEIILVVIGILIALQINNWNEYRKESKIETLILKQLKQEFEANKLQLAQRVKIRNNIINSGSDLLSYFGNTEFIPKDTLIVKFARICNPTSFDPVQNDLVSSGNLNMIKNQKLKQLLTNWSTNFLQLRETEQMFFRFYENTIATYAIEKGIGGSVSQAYWQDNKNILSLLSKDGIYNPFKEKSKISKSVRSIFEDPEFEGIVSQTISLNVFNNLESKTLNNHIDDILEAIKQELKKKEND